jgi:hypothetical protein
MVATIRDSELSHEFEDELELEEEGLGEEEWEEEGIFGAIAQGLGSLLGEGEGEDEYEEEDEAHAHEYEDEHGFGEHGFGEHGFGEHGFGEHGFGEHGFGEHGFGEHGFGEHGFGEMEGEYFFKGLGRILKRVAKVAAPMVLSAVGGPLGGVLGKVATSALGEGEFEDESGMGEYEDEYEFEDEAAMGEYEAVLASPMGETEALAELMAAVASGAQTEAEAEAMIGAATITALSPRERRELRRVLAHMVRGTAILTRLLRRRRTTRPAVRAIPTIVHATARTLSRRAAAGQPVTRRIAAQVMARHTRRVLGTPVVCQAAVRRNSGASRIAARRVAARRPTAYRRSAPVYRSAYRPAASARPRRRY